MMPKRSAGAQWSWSIAVYVDPMLGIATGAKVATLEEAKAQFRQNWQRAKAHSAPMDEAAMQTRLRAPAPSRRALGVEPLL